MKSREEIDENIQQQQKNKQKIEGRSFWCENNFEINKPKSIILSSGLIFKSRPDYPTLSSFNSMSTLPGSSSRGYSLTMTHRLLTIVFESQFSTNLTHNWLIGSFRPQITLIENWQKLKLK